MTYPRSHLVDPSGGIYHVCSRCVRRAYLCGQDNESGYNFNHRRLWIEDRILLLSSLFAAEVFGYAVMSNHYHLVLKMSPADTGSWSDADVVERWLKLNPRMREDDAQRDSRKLALLEDAGRVKILRERLGSLSWFMRYLNEPLARLANMEDGCKGRFWEGRFKSQILLDELAVLACMIYVDLNPVRAGLSSGPLDTEHTSMARRITEKRDRGLPMRTMGAKSKDLPFAYSLASFIRLARWTQQVQHSKRPTRFGGIPPSDIWISQYIPKVGSWQRAQGSTQSLAEYANSLGQCWIKKCSAAA